MSDWKRVALALADAFAVAAAKAEEDRGALIVERVALQSELRESRAETEDARRRCVELEQELETAREARDILLAERNHALAEHAAHLKAMGAER